MEEIFNLAVWGIFFFVIIVQFIKSIRIVPTKTAYIVERLGRYHSTLGPGFHALFPFLDKVAYIHDLKEETIEVPPQECFSKDEVNVEVDGVIYISVQDPAKASYGITHYKYAAVQLAQTTIRAVIGTLDLDRTFEERDMISSKVVEVLGQAGLTWGVKVHRYEIKNIVPPLSVKNSMEKQVTAEREKKAILAHSEGDKQSRINQSEGIKREMINLSEGEMQKRINEAEGKANEVLTLANATADSIKKVAEAISLEGGEKAINLQMAEKLFGKLSLVADGKTRVILPANIANFDEWLGNIGVKIQ